LSFESDNNNHEGSLMRLRVLRALAVSISFLVKGVHPEVKLCIVVE